MTITLEETYNAIEEQFEKAAKLYGSYCDYIDTDLARQFLDSIKKANREGIVSDVKDLSFLRITTLKYPEMYVDTDDEDGQRMMADIERSANDLLKAITEVVETIEFVVGTEQGEEATAYHEDFAFTEDD